MRAISTPVSVLLLAAMMSCSAEQASEGEGGQSPSTPGVAMGASAGTGEAVPHPTTLAMVNWEELELTPEQVQAIRDIEERMAQEISAPLAEMAGLSAPLFVFGDPMPDEAEVRAIVRRKAEVEADLFLVFGQTGEDVFEVLDDEQRDELRELYRSQYYNPTPPDQYAPTSQSCRTGGSGGGVRVSDRVKLVYSVDFDGDTATVGAVFVGKADVKLYGSPSPRGQPELPNGPDFLSGGTMESWFMGYDANSHTAWVQTQEVPLGDDNVVLVGGIDVLHEPPRVAGVRRIPAKVYTGGCPEGRAWEDILIEELEKVPEIRDFMQSSAGGDA